MCVALPEVLAFDLSVDASLAPDNASLLCVCGSLPSLRVHALEAVRQLDAHLNHLMCLTNDVSLG